ncbi:MAG: type IVB secretion system coupling complex protein DotM/IcmP [Legionellaceae bacterium]|nr:type IVB secretion system coupling complex protein DotM/IcmP [Legionellaceae bacterium]
MAQQQQSGGGDNSLAPVWITILLFLTAYFIWYLAHRYIVMAIFAVDLVQAKLVHLVLGGSVLAEEIDLMQTVDPALVQWSDLVELTSRVGAYMRYPFAVVLCGLALILYRSNTALRYRKTYSMKSLREQEQKNWPCITPIVKAEDLVSQDINVGPWAMALTPVEFARNHKLLKREDPLIDTPLPGLELTAGIRRGDAKRIFTLQLGAAWEGFDRCAPQVKALAAVFMARMCRDREAAVLILGVLDTTSADGKPDYSVATPTFEKYKNSELVQEVVARHAYVLTVMAALIMAARNDGVVPTSEFLWLKVVDRRLWYMLNSAGRQTPYAEVGGAFAHWRAEQVMQRRSLTPMIDEAIKALEVAIKEVKLSPKEFQGLEA